MFDIIWGIIKLIIFVYLSLGIISLIINKKYFILILNDKKFRKLKWKIILLIETIILWPLTLGLSYRVIRNFLLKKSLRSIKN